MPPAEGLNTDFMRGLHLAKKGEEDEAIHYFDFVLPRLKKAENHAKGKIPLMIECIQYPGETVFVPGGWWHTVINLDNTIAITENVCNYGNFDRVWYRTRTRRKRLAYRWLKLLRVHEKDMYVKAVMMNRRDLWEMRTPPYSVKQFTDDQSESSSESSSSSNALIDELTLDEIRIAKNPKLEKDADPLASIEDPFLKGRVLLPGKSYDEEMVFLNRINQSLKQASMQEEKNTFIKDNFGGNFVKEPID